MVVSEFPIGSVGLGVGSGLTISGLAPVGIMCASSISFLSSISTLITNEYFSKLKIRCTKLRDRIQVITLLYEKTLKQSMIIIEDHEINILKKISFRETTQTTNTKKGSSYCFTRSRSRIKYIQIL